MYCSSTPPNRSPQFVRTVTHLKNRAVIFTPNGLQLTLTVSGGSSCVWDGIYFIQWPNGSKSRHSDADQPETPHTTASTANPWAKETTYR
ncbi:hypothetical protein MHYP_G00295300 [Metynnis hypsauchen]